MSKIAELILETDDRPAVAVKEWGLDLWIVPMSGTERDSYDLDLHRAKQAGEDLDNWRSRFLVRCLYADEPTGPNGALQRVRIFANEQAADLGAKNAETIGRLYDIASKVNGTQPGAVEDAAKNSLGEASASPG